MTRPEFLSVQSSGSGLSAMSHEQKMVKEKDVKFDGEAGHLELTDIRLVWIKKPSRWGAVKKGVVIGGALLGAAALAGAGRDSRGVGRVLARGLSRTLAFAAVGVAISHWSQDSFYNKDKNGNTESIAIPILAITQATQTGKRLVVELKSGGDMIFEFKQKKVIPSVIANITSAQDRGKCPFCGTNAGNANACPKCGAPIEGGGTGGAGDVPAAGGENFCTNCGNPLPPDAKFCGGCGHRT